MCVTDCDSETTSLLNTAVKVGENVTMHCSMTNGSHKMQWFVHNPVKKIVSSSITEFSRHFLAVDSSNPSLRDMSEFPRHVLTSDSSNPTLSIISTQLADANRYQCTEMETLSSSSAELSVLGWLTLLLTFNCKKKILL